MDEQRSAEDVDSEIATETTPLTTTQTTNYTETGGSRTPEETTTPATTSGQRPDPESLNICCSFIGFLMKCVLFIIFIVVLYKYNTLSSSCNPTQSKITINSLQAQLTQLLTTSDTDSIKSTIKESKSKLNTLKIPHGQYVRFNAASYMDGARVSERQSFLSSRYSREQTGYVLFERDELPRGSAWCSDDEQPVLTISLSKNTTPLAVSYQHTKDYKDVPIGAPRIYDVYACEDSECNYAFPLVTDCTYQIPKAREKGKEQICNITQNLFDTEVNKIQFRFRHNHGNVDETCAYLIRVYGEKRPSRPEFHPRNVELCTEIAYDYYHSSYSYLMRNKSCSILYMNKCCKDCPECCRKCEIEDFNSEYLFGLVVGIIFIAITFSFIMCPCGFLAYLVHMRRKHKKSLLSGEPNETEPNQDVVNNEVAENEAQPDEVITEDPT